MRFNNLKCETFKSTVLTETEQYHFMKDGLHAGVNVHVSLLAPFPILIRPMHAGGKASPGKTVATIQW